MAEKQSNFAKFLELVTNGSPEYQAKMKEKYGDWNDPKVRANIKKNAKSAAEDAKTFAKLSAEETKNFAKNQSNEFREKAKKSREYWKENKAEFREKMRGMSHAEKRAFYENNFDEWGLPHPQIYHMEKKRSIFWRAFWGITFLLAAAIGILGIVAISSTGRMPTYLTDWRNSFGLAAEWIGLVLLVAIAIASAISLNWFGFFLPAALFATIFAGSLHIIPAMIPAIWVVAVLLSIGFSILFHRSWKVRASRWNKQHYGTEMTGWDLIDGKFAKNSAQDSADISDEVRVFAKMGEATRYVESQNLKKAFVDAKLGSVKIYFQNAKISDGKADFYLDAKLGAIELNVPKNWKLISEVNAAAGGISENGHAEINENSPVITLHGSATMGAITVNYL
jgi:predicted membrane protein